MRWRPSRASSGAGSGAWCCATGGSATAGPRSSRRGDIPAESVVLKARPADDSATPSFAPAGIDEVCATIAAVRPDVVFAPHVETSSGIVLPDQYVRRVADAVHAVGGIFVLDSIASGALWVNMEESGVDVLISAPQKGWSGSPCAGLVMLGPEGRVRTAVHAQHQLRVRSPHVAQGDGRLRGRGAHLSFDNADRRAPLLPRGHDRDARLRTRQCKRPAVGAGTPRPSAPRRPRLQERRRAGVRGPGGRGQPYRRPGHQGRLAVRRGGPADRCRRAPALRRAPTAFQTFRLGLFGLDKLGNVDRTVDTLAAALDRVLARSRPVVHAG